jgi:hypothetical protein
MKKITAFQSLNGVIEKDPIRATAWDIVHLSEKDNVGTSLSFSAALWLIQNRSTIVDMIESVGNFNDE